MAGAVSGGVVCAVGVSSWRKVSDTMLYVVVESPLSRDFIQKDIRVRFFFFGQEYRRTFFWGGKVFKVEVCKVGRGF